MAADGSAPRRIAIGVEYDGSRFSGWQTQGDPTLPTVQRSLEQALARVADHPVKLFCAGRTDSGVHATGQVAHFECRTDRGEKAWVRGTNSNLPPSVRVTWARPVAPDFHARFSATARRYRYIIQISPVASAILAGKVTHQRQPLDIHNMHAAGQLLLGENDFSAFRAAGCQSRSANRCIHWLNVSEVGGFIVVDIQANAFLQHMVRNIVGVLLEIGATRQPPGWARELLNGRDRTAAAITAPPDGLYLVQVSYPEHCGLPAVIPGPAFLHPIP